MRRYYAILLVIGAGLLVWAAMTTGTVVWVGAYPLTVQVIEETPGTIRAVYCRTGSAPNFYLDYPRLLDDPRAFARATAEPFEGEPLTVEVRTCGRSTPEGRELSYAQDRGLVVIAEDASGERSMKAIAIPDGRASRRVTVRIP